ncbi:hypothetical protein AGRO_4069 [Agrobacterium sp. ATCC 31749]|nr:hypothetical protein AGRO_4069 [Agrobacterium sp. ATCC 31749]
MHEWRHRTADVAKLLCCGSSCPQLPFLILWRTMRQAV